MPMTSRMGIMLLGASLLLTACSRFSVDNGYHSPDESSSPYTSFTIVYPGGDLSHKQGVSTTIARFEQSHPNIGITEGKESGTGSYSDYLKTKVAVGEFPDLIEIRDTELFASAGLLAEMPEELLYPFLSVEKVNGKVYTLPLERTPPQGIIYNKSLFQQAGIDSPPRTYGQFLSNNDKLKKLGIVPLVVGGKDLWHMGFWINKFMIDEVYAKDPNWNYKRTQHLVSWTDPEPSRAMELLAGLWERGDVDADYETTADGQTASLLVSGEAAMLFSGPWMFNQIQSADPAFSYGFFVLPDEAGHVNLAGAPSANGWAISAEAANNPAKLEAIQQFLTFFYDDAQYSDYLQAVNGLSAKASAEDEPMSEAMKSLMDALDDSHTTLASQMNNYGGDNLLPPMFRDWFYKKMMKVLSGGESLEEALTEADQEWDREVQAMR
ncbi:ABC transporter substrate-binding protein [Paenibacillus sp. HB172176]|uniref:ABC transporter substrate-binding protein n=1 Tax=Paenibacillus sp. HB172176 TaxID=2493690 RepID=UPI00143BB134|nr:ABC transporter substrate-binding protein [Paenibacillus sp. HB172176]